MKKFFGTIIFLVLLIVIAAQVLLPKFIEMCIESELDSKLHPSSQTVIVDAMPAVKLLYGDADSIRGTMENVQLNNLNFTGFHYEFNNILVNPVSLLANQKIEVLRNGNGTIEGIVTNDDLTDYMEKQISGMTDASTTIEGGKITVNGTINVGGFLKGNAQITGILDLDNNVLRFEPQRFSLNGATVSGLNSSLLRPVTIYDFNEFPMPITARSLTVKNGEIRVKVIPTIK